MGINPSTSKGERKPGSLAPAILIGSVIVFLLCCACLAVVGGLIGLFLNQDLEAVGLKWSLLISPTPVVIRPEFTPPGDVSQLPEGKQPGDSANKPGHSALASSEEMVSTETLGVLLQATVPENNPVELARRLGGEAGDISEMPGEPAPDEILIGSQHEFWISNSDTNENLQVQTTLQSISEHVYFWVEDGVIFKRDELERLVNTFENEIYPRTRKFFGSEWRPGVDGDPHIYIILAGGLGKSIAGYYSSRDEYPSQVYEFSNTHELFLISADLINLGEEFSYSVLAHEFQHMIHWNQDRNEDSWINEGFSELAGFINGYGVGYHDYVYIKDTDLQLNDWPQDDRGAHYGAAFLYLNYYLNRFGEKITQSAINSSANSFEGLDEALVENDVKDSETGRIIRAEDVFADWVLASYLHDESIGDGRYTYNNYPDAPQASETETIDNCPSTMQTRDVSQFGVDYIEITCPGNYELRFEGSIFTKVLPVEPYSGQFYFWSNRGDESDMVMQRGFDFSDHKGSLTLTFQTWYDLEKDYDYVYLLASTDGGKNWDILITPSGTAEDPSGNSYGWAYNGASGGEAKLGEKASGLESANWIWETVNLSAYAGKKVLLRFEYITDAVANGEGLLIDDIGIPEIGYFSDFESDDGGWEAEGFVRIENTLPQEYRLAIIEMGEETRLTKFTVTGNNTLVVPIKIENKNQKVVFTVSGTTPFTRQKTAYRFEVDKIN